ncbi:MAG: nickel-responsive transcriptional regulator NikR [Acidobacteriaceae bacterium]
MSQLSRTGVSLEEDLLREFDGLLARRGYQNRSEAIRDLIREALLGESVDTNQPMVGTLTLVYDHHVPELSEKLTAAQHGAGAMVLAATHVHLDHNYCLEVIIMKGRSREIQEVADRLRALRGVELGKLVLTSSGKELKRGGHGRGRAHGHGEREPTHVT